MTLSKQQLESYHRHGFLAGVRVMNEGEMARYGAQFNRIEAKLGRENCAIALINSHFEQLFVWEMATHPNLLDAVESLIGPQEESRAVCLELSPGEISIHDGKLIHASPPNRSTRRRCGLVVRFIRPNVRPTGNAPQGGIHRPVLVRGEDRYRHFQCAPPPFPFRTHGD